MCIITQNIETEVAQGGVQKICSAQSLQLMTISKTKNRAITGLNLILNAILSDQILQGADANRIFRRTRVNDDAVAAVNVGHQNVGRGLPGAQVMVLNKTL